VRCAISTSGLLTIRTERSLADESAFIGSNRFDFPEPPHTRVHPPRKSSAISVRRSHSVG
jgi:hypothetical protein